MRHTQRKGPAIGAPGPEDVGDRAGRSTNHTDNTSNKKSKDRLGEAIRFLEWLRPAGPRALTAIIPDGTTLTKSFGPKQPNATRDWLEAYDGERNLYYSLNPTPKGLAQKADKTEILAAEFVHVDIDPREGESPDECKARALAEIKASDLPEPSAAIDSGNGIQFLWRLAAPVVPTENVEPVNKKLIEMFGAGKGTHNLDRILRMPGTTNLPNAKKLRAGRARCLSTVLWMKDISYPFDQFPNVDAAKDSFSPNGEHKPRRSNGRDRPRAEVDIDDLPLPEHLRKQIRKPDYSRFNGDRSRAVLAATSQLVRHVPDEATVLGILLNPAYGISAHILDQSDAHRAALRVFDRAMLDQCEFAKDGKGHVYAAVPKNVRIALSLLGVDVSYNAFADRFEVKGLPDNYGPFLDDKSIDRLWLLVDEKFGFRPQKSFLETVIQDDAVNRYSFHPVCDYLDALEWDGTPRLDTWLVDYAGATASPYVQAVSSITLIAAVRRVRRPGCKFDELPVFESPRQGTDKSTALEILAVKRDWFTDHLPLNADPKLVIEQTGGKWIIECGELAGMRRGDIDKLKTMLSRNTDRARLAYGHLPTERARQFICIGTTNEREYLKDLTGNRRFWPVLVKRFDTKALKRDRDQLWAEASAREANGESIRLDEALWVEANKEQTKRTSVDPWQDILKPHLAQYGEAAMKIATTDLWKLLGADTARMGQYESTRLTTVMATLGWDRNDNRQIKVDGAFVSGYVKGPKPWRLIRVNRDNDDVETQLDELRRKL